jgi:hypothetical protein
MAMGILTRTLLELTDLFGLLMMGLMHSCLNRHNGKTKTKMVSGIIQQDSKQMIVLHKQVLRYLTALDALMVMVMATQTKMVAGSLLTEQTLVQARVEVPMLTALAALILMAMVTLTLMVVGLQQTGLTFGLVMLPNGLMAMVIRLVTTPLEPLATHVLGWLGPQIETDTAAMIQMAMDTQTLTLQEPMVLFGLLLMEQMLLPQSQPNGLTKMVMVMVIIHRASTQIPAPLFTEHRTS